MSIFAQEKLTAELTETIQTEQLKSEIFICWTQAGFVVLLLFLWWIAPAAHQGTVLFEPVPVILLCYLPFVLIRAFWAHKRYTNQFFVYFGIFTDIAMLTTLIWSFHIQYIQPPAFYLKAPTFLYFLMFIGLRTLRFDLLPIVITGILAAISWAGLTTFAALDESAMITRSFVQWANGPFLLVGAEVEKVVILLIVTSILTLAAYRGKKLLLESILVTKSNQNFSRFFNPQVARKIKQEEKFQPGKGEMKQIAILFMDIRGFTKLAKDHNPDWIMTLLTEFQQVVVPIIDRHHGVIDKFLGDGMLAHFGALSHADTFAADCLRAIEEINLELDLWNERRAKAGNRQLRFGIGCDSGEVIFGTVGNQDRLELTIIGDPVNTASKIEQFTKGRAMRACTTQSTYQLAVSQGFQGQSGHELPHARVTGIGKPLDLVQLHPPSEQHQLISNG